MKIDIHDFFAACPKGICHRGYHDLERSENGGPAFQNAIDHNLPFECDVHLAKDNELIVCHDSSLKRVTGREGEIEGLSVPEIKEYRLEDGSALLTAEELYALWEEKVPLVLELKVANGNAKPLAERVRKFLATIKDESKLVLISFCPEILDELSDVPFNRGLLIGDKRDLSYKQRHSYKLENYDFIDLNVVFLCLPMFKRYKKNGGAILTWTVRNQKDYEVTMKKATCPTWEAVDCRAEKKDRKVDAFLDNLAKS